MKKLLFILSILSFNVASKAQCPPNATAFALNYALCSPSPGCGVLLNGWPEGVIVSIIGGNPLREITSVQIPGTYPGPGVGDAFVCVPCDVPLIFASSVPGSTNGCVIINTITTPVKLNHFSVDQIEKDSYTINWRTSSETGHEKYTIERSVDNINFTSIITVNAQGGSTDEKKYTHTDKLTDQSKAYYRLKTTDVSGKTSYSEIVLIKHQTNVAVNIYPNPTSNSFKISLPEKQLPATVKIYNAQGLEIFSQKTTETTLTVKEKIPAGIYTVRVVNADNTSVTQKVIKQ
ncbi:T9SS type A sorting domain-containing protein [Ferruginibacter sp. SUN002]|uniref:T9SS type A sorting domain-containing protein n=1 Tax=Ferruginibacter sp. SUN002 TaxID=2937789 RepID=UPI003D35D808